MSDDKLLKMEVRGLMLDPSSNVPIVILRDESETEFLPIWIGVFEANAIALKLEGVQPPRPMSHDLMSDLISSLDAKVRQIIICDLQESTFLAQIVLLVGGEGKDQQHEILVDARPSDAIALALRAEAPIFVNEKVFNKAKASNLDGSADDEEKLKKWLEDVDPDELGKYTM